MQRKGTHLTGFWMETPGLEMLLQWLSVLLLTAGTSQAAQPSSQ